MKIVTIAGRLLLCALLVHYVSGCKKVAEELLKDPCADLKICNIKSINFSGIPKGAPVNIATFKYDAYGNPLSVTNTVVATGSPNLAFKYDAQHRLTDFYKPYSNGQFESWSKYLYDGSGRIDSDTTFVFGTITPTGPANSFKYYVTKYTYDGTCRIVRTSTVLAPGEFPQIRDFNYDANGNLVKPGVVYDNNVNLHRTNKVFMFADNDYSMNNPYTAADYNGYNLPAVISSGAPIPSLFFLGRPIDYAKIKFQCD